MNEKYKISIITPTLNSEKDIESCILSVAGQGYKNIEHLIIDGLSMDRTLEIVKKYVKIYPHIKLVSEKDRGVYDAMNKGIDSSTGDWLYFLGSDDILFNNDVFSNISNNLDDVDILYGNVMWGNENIIYDGKFSPLKLMEKNICHQAVFFRKIIFQRLGRFDIKYKVWADWVFNIKWINDDSFKHKYIDIIICIFNPNGISAVGKDERFTEDFEKNIINYFPKEYRDIHKKIVGLNQLTCSQQQEIEVRGKVIENNNHTVSAQQQEIELKGKVIEEKYTTINSLQQEIQQNINNLAVKDQTLNLRDQEISLFKAQLELRVNELAQIYSCCGWRIIQYIRRIMVAILPYGSFRRRIIRFFFRVCRKGYRFIKYSLRLTGRVFTILRKNNLFVLFKKVHRYISNKIKNIVNNYKRKITEKKKFLGLKNIFYKKSNPEYIQEVYDIKFLDVKKIDFVKYDKPEVSIVIPVYNKWQFTYNCLKELKKNTQGIKFEVIIIDNASSDDTAILIKKVKNITYLKNMVNHGFAKACNQGANQAKGEYVVFLNNDTIPLYGWLNALIDELKQNPRVGIVGSKLLYPTGMVQHAGVIYPDLDHPCFPYHIYRNTKKGDDKEVNKKKFFRSLTGACLVLRRNLFEKIGGFDEIYKNGYEDTDLCFKAASLGYFIVYCPKSCLYHYESISDGRFEADLSNRDFFVNRWKNSLLLQNNLAVGLEVDKPSVVKICSLSRAFTVNIREHGFLETMRRVFLYIHKFRQMRFGVVTKNIKLPSYHYHNEKPYYYGVNLFGYYNYQFGLAKNIQSMAGFLSLVRVPYTVTNISAGGHKESINNLDSTYKNDYCINIIFVNPDNCDFLFSQYPYGTYFDGKYNIAYWVHETDYIPEKFFTYAALFDEIWTPSEFSKKALLALKKKIVVVPMIGNFISTKKPIDNPSLEENIFGNNDYKKFLFITDYFSCPYRKNIKLLVDVFKRIYESGRKYKLILKIKNAPKSYVDSLAFLVKDLPVYILISDLTSDELHYLYSNIDYYVSLHASEGYGLTILEAINYNITPIVTAYGGVLDFCNKDNAVFIDFDLVDIPKESMYPGQGKWAQPSFDDAVSKISLLIDNSKIRKPSRDIFKQINEKKLSKNIFKHLKQIKSK